MRYPNYVGCCMRPMVLYLTGYRNRDLGIKYGHQASRSRNFKFLTLQLPPVLRPTFFVHSDREYRGTQCINARKIHFKTTPKIGGLKMFGGMALFAFAAFGGLYPHFTRAYYGPKYADKNSFILRELLSI